MISGTAYTHPDKRRDGGYVVIAVAGFLVVFCGILGLTADVGMLYFQKGHMQAAADSAAIAAARELWRGNTTLVESAARDDATVNGYTDSVSGATVTVARQPTSGTYNGNSNYIQVIVGRAEPTFFMKVLGTSSVNVNARAVAGLDSSDKCIYLLNGRRGNGRERRPHPLNSPCDIVINSSGVPAEEAEAQIPSQLENRRVWHLWSRYL
jgi:Flp pilus assembly protein TadG